MAEVSDQQRPGSADQETLERAPGRREPRRGRAMALTILHHADARRVGERFVFDPATGPVELGRLAPQFAQPGYPESAPLDDPFVSRRASLLAGTPSAMRWVRGDHGSDMVADGTPVADAASFDGAALELGVVLELAGRAVLLLHTIESAAPSSAPSCGLVGESDGIARVRTAIARFAALDVPLLLRGESGTGKELVARAIHEQSGRAGPLVALNMAAVAPSVAASELFGHARGAFTGAVREHEGAFRAADRGTLFLDEIGDAPADVQPMLLRALESGEVLAVGSTRPVRVDVRLVTATDVDLEHAVAAGRFRSSLLHRLAGVQIVLPPLRQRRDDIARLLVAFLRSELDRIGLADRLELRDLQAPPWLPAELVARLVRHAWPGNVRQLRNVARQIVLASGSEAHAQLDASVDLSVAGAAQSPPAPVIVNEPGGRAARRPGEVSADELREALEACGWKLGPTAQRLGIPRSSLYDLIDRTPGLRRARDISRDDLEAAIRDVGSSAQALARHLGVSPRGIKLRMKELGFD